MQAGDGKNGDAGEHIGEPRLRVDVVETASRDDGEHDGGTLGAGEGPVSTPECNSSQSALGRIVREKNPAILQEPGKAIPSLQHVIDRLDHLARFAERGALPFQPIAHVVEQRLALLLPRGQPFCGAQSIDLAFDLEQRIVPLDGPQGDWRDRLAFAFAVAGIFLDVGQFKEFTPRVRMAKGEGDRYRFLFGDTERLEAIVTITLQNAAISGKVLLRMLAAAVARRIGVRPLGWTDWDEELTSLPGFRKEDPWQNIAVTVSNSNGRSCRSSWPEKRCTVWQNVMTCRVTLSASG